MTREEALKIVRENYPHFGTTEPWLDLEKALATLVPELRESEDERIKKAIVHILYENYSDAAVVEGVKIAEIVAWLEKQKENPKSADSIPSDCVSDAKCEDRSPKHTDSFGTDIRDTPAYWRGWDDAMKQKAQKPEERFEEAREKYQVEWSEEE